MWELLPTFASPWALLPGAVAIGILWKLFRRAHRKVRPIAFPWRGLFIDNPPQATSWPPPWLWCLLAAVLCFALASAEPVFRQPDDTPQHIVILLETGVASQSREQGRSRLETLVGLLAEIVKQRPARDRFLLVSAGMEPVESDEWLSAGELLRELKKIEASDGPTDWTAAFDRAEVHLAHTDGQLIVAAGTPSAHYGEWLKATGLEERPHMFVRAGRTASNAGIESVAVFHSPFAETTETLEVHVRLRAFGSDQQRGVEVRLNGEQLQNREVSISHKQAMTLTLLKFREAGQLEIRLLPGDRQPADDAARAIIPEVKPLRVGVLSQDASVPRFLERLPGVEMTVLAAPNQAMTVDLCVVDRRMVADDSLPDANCLLYAGTGAPTPATLLGVHDQHPLCKGLGSPDFRSFDEAWLNSVPGADIAMVGAISDADALPRGFPQPVVWTQERRGRRTAGFAFSPFGFDYHQFRKMPLLLLNTIEWLSPRASQPLAVQLGAHPEFFEGSRAKIWEASATAKPSDGTPANPDSPPLTKLDRAGFYRAAMEGQAPWQFAANAPTVPIVGEAGSAVTALSRGANKPAGQSDRPINFWLWVVGCVLLGLELLLFVNCVVTCANPLAYLAQRRLLREATLNAARRDLERRQNKRA